MKTAKALIDEALLPSISKRMDEVSREDELRTVVSNMQRAIASAGGHVDDTESAAVIIAGGLEQLMSIAKGERLNAVASQIASTVKKLEKP